MLPSSVILKSLRRPLPEHLIYLRVEFVDGRRIRLSVRQSLFRLAGSRRCRRRSCPIGRRRIARRLCQVGLQFIDLLLQILDSCLQRFKVGTARSRNQKRKDATLDHIYCPATSHQSFPHAE
jgi:hypothetical protein